MKKRVIIASLIAVAVIGTGVGALMGKPKEIKPAAATATETQHKTLSVTQTDVREPSTPEPTPTVTPVATPKPSPKATQQPQAPIVYKWADDMAAAHIDEASYGYVTEMLLDTNGWRISGPNLWQGNAWVQGKANDEATIITMLPRARRWVEQNYGGNWATAYSNWINLGNF